GHNGKMKEAAITRYARAMAEDRWDGDASTLSFDRHGDLMDGQNRLEACRRSGKAFPTLVRTGLRPESMRHIDIGIPRSVSDTFRLEKIKFATGASASISLRLRYEDAEAAGRKIGQPLDSK